MLIEMCHVVWYSPDLFIAVIYLSLSLPMKDYSRLDNLDGPYMEYILLHYITTANQ